MSAEPPAPLDRRALLRRMAIGGAAVWATPMMHSVASAQAAASCGDGPLVLDWDTFTTNSIFSSTTIADVVITITGIAGPGTTLFTTNRQIRNGPSGGVNQKYLRFEMYPTAQGIYQTITIAFSKPVTNLAFTVFDIDTIANPGWRDELLLNTPGAAWTIPPGSDVRRVGTSTPPLFRNLDNNNNVDYDENDGNLNLRHAGPITSFVMTYRNGDRINAGNQYIGLGDITFGC